MPWFKNLLHSITHKNFVVKDIWEKIDNNSITKKELLSYIADITYRKDLMVEELRGLYKAYGISFKGFKSFDIACKHLYASVKDSSEESYNYLIKLESMITTEQQRHLALIKMAVTPDGKKVYEQIMANNEQAATFNKIFGSKDASGRVKEDGIYQKIWSEIHRLAEYLLTKKDKANA